MTKQAYIKKGHSNMYKVCRDILAAGITLSIEAAIIKAEARLKEVEKKRDAQLDGAYGASRSESAAKRAESRIIALYSEEIGELEEEIKQLKKEQETEC